MERLLTTFSGANFTFKPRTKITLLIKSLYPVKANLTQAVPAGNLPFTRFVEVSLQFRLLSPGQQIWFELLFLNFSFICLHWNRFWTELMDVLHWDGTLSAKDFRIGAFAFAQKWESCNLAFPPWSWLPCPKHPWLAPPEVTTLLTFF